MTFPKRLALVLALVGGLSGPAAAEEADPGAAALKARFTELLAAAMANDREKAMEITVAMLPDEARLAKALGPGADDAVKAKFWAMHAKIPRNDPGIAGMLLGKREQTEIGVHAATGAEIAAYTEGGVAWSEFPGGARRLAEGGILNPGMTFYEVEYLEPGKDAGMKYHLFYWDGTAWTMLGPMWRALDPS